MLDEDYNLKIVDFGFAAALTGVGGMGRMQTYLGTQEYMAPEIHQRRQYSGSSVDIFASAKILYTMLSASFPFDKAIPSDPKYRLVA